MTDKNVVTRTCLKEHSYKVNEFKPNEHWWCFDEHVIVIAEKG